MRTQNIKGPFPASRDASPAHTPPVRFGDRPALTVPAHLRHHSVNAAASARLERQPWLGLKGLVVMAPLFVALAVGAGSLEASLLVLAPLTTLALPLLVVVAFWWRDWPGNHLPVSVSRWADGLLTVWLAVLFTALGQWIAGGVDVRGLFEPHPGAGHVPTFPATMPIAGALFTAMLQITIVGEGWPLRRLGPITGGLCALALSWLAALALYFALVRFQPPPGSGLSARSGPMSAPHFAAMLLLIGAWQVWVFLVARGGALTRIASRTRRLVSSHAIVIGAGLGSYWLLIRLFHLSAPTVNAVAGCVLAAGLLGGLLFEGWPFVDRSRHALPLTFLAVGSLAAVLYALLEVCAHAANWTSAPSDLWVSYAATNALGVAIILHVAVTNRWPLHVDVPAPAIAAPAAD